MAKADSGQRSSTRFFGFRWAYIALACLLWFNLLLMTSGSEDVALFSPTYLIWNVFTGDIPETNSLAMHGVFGLDFDYGTRSGASLLSILLLAGAAVLFIVPESGTTKLLPAMRSMHLRAKIIASCMFGFMAVAMMACTLDAIDVDMVQFFTNLGIMTDYSVGGFIVTRDDFQPEYGIISQVSLGSLATGIILVGGSLFLVMSFMKLGRNRYWQVERWTLLLTLSSVALLFSSLPFFHADDYSYRRHEVYLGGCYTGWFVGWSALTFSWTCRTALLMMMRHYEKATMESDEPNCFACGYDLRMLTTSKCPECGTEISMERMEKIKKRTERLMVSAHAESRSTTR